MVKNENININNFLNCIFCLTNSPKSKDITNVDSLKIRSQYFADIFLFFFFYMNA